jgi:hypothetical protein
MAIMPQRTSQKRSRLTPIKERAPKLRMVEIALDNLTGYLYGIDQANIWFRIWERDNSTTHETMCDNGFICLTDQYDVDLTHYPNLARYFPTFYVLNPKHTSKGYKAWRSKMASRQNTYQPRIPNLNRSTL